MAHLDEDEVAGLHLGENAVPGAFINKGAAAASSVGAVGDIDPAGVKVVGEVVAPAEVGLIVGGGITNDEDGGQRGIERGGWSSRGLRRCRRGLHCTLSKAGDGSERKDHGEETKEGADWLDFWHGRKSSRWATGISIQIIFPDLPEIFAH